jgi:VWFA-related protein
MRAMITLSARRRRRLRVVAVLALAFAASAVTAARRAEAPDPTAHLPVAHREWLEEVSSLISKKEREAFLALEKDYQRDAFIERFWQERDPYPDTTRNELRDAWESRLAQARQQFTDLDEDRARFFLLNGPPDGTLEPRCSVLTPLEIWVYARSERIPEDLVLIFYQRFSQGVYEVWQPSQGVSSLLQFPRPGTSTNVLLEEIASNCVRSDEIVGAIVSILRRGTVQYALLVDRAQQPIAPPSREWVATFNSYSTDLPEGASRLPAELGIEFPGRRQSRTVVQTTVAVPTSAAGTAENAGSSSYNFLLNGEVLIEHEARRLFDAFRYKFDFAAGDVAGVTIPLVFERFLRPGSYRLIVRVEDLNTGAVYRSENGLEVPTLGDMATTTVDDETAKILAEANAALSNLEESIQIVTPRGQYQSGLVRFDTLITGSQIAEVEFALDGRPILRKSRPPYSVELDLGQVPNTRALRAVAYDASGGEIASDEELLNASPHRFSVRLIEPRRGRKYDRSLRAEAAVDVPEGASLERVEFFLNEDLVATLYQEPFSQPILLPPADAVAYVRAVAYQTDGNSTEDLVFVNAPANLEELEVQFVELFTTVLDKQSRPVDDLTREEFKVIEDGVPQQIVRFEQLENLPIHVAVLLDVSASMEPRIDAARNAALGFFEQAIGPADRAALIPFNDRPSLAVKMTNRHADLGAGLAGIKAERGTALYDSIVFSLFYFNGIKGQRAMLLLSDGDDESSRFTFDQTLDFARRAGVAIYTIGVDLKRAERETRRVLSRLADETGGRSFLIESVSELAPIYAEIEHELRSRYLLAYQSTNAARDSKFRTVDVQVSRPGLEPKTIRGYYP